MYFELELLLCYRYQGWVNIAASHFVGFDMFQHICWIVNPSLAHFGFDNIMGQSFVALSSELTVLSNSHQGYQNPQFTSRN